MIDVAIGVDIGSSYIKAAARSKDGTIQSISRVQSPMATTQTLSGLVEANLWWDSTKHVIRSVLNPNTPSHLHAVSLCISAITPTLVVFDSECRVTAYGILYSWLPALLLETSLVHCDRHLTELRLKILREFAYKKQFISPCITELVGYLNWRLTGELTVNSISLAEMGMDSQNNDHELLNCDDGCHPHLVSPAQQIGKINNISSNELGIDIGVPVCGGCPDTLGSVVGAGLIEASESMVYLGTFGSLLHLECEVEKLINTQHCSASPFRWLLSIPGMGPEIEHLSHKWFKTVCAKDRMNSFDLAAENAMPGAGGSLFLVPRWKKGMSQVGRFEFLPDKNGCFGDISRKSRAVLESIGYAIRAIYHQLPNSMKVSGGGARSLTWLNSLSCVLGMNIRTQDMSWEAAGTADIAARLIWEQDFIQRPCYEVGYQGIRNQEMIDDNFNRIKEVYRKNDWL